MSDEHAKDPERPWLERIEIPAAPGDPLLELAHLREVKAHREWLIEGLRARIADLERAGQELAEHAANLDSLAGARAQRVEQLEAHARNLEARRAEAEAHVARLLEHAGNLERRVEQREARGASLEAHARNLQARRAEAEAHAANLEGLARVRGERAENLEGHAQNLEAEVARLAARVAELEAHTANVERRGRPRPLRFGGPGIFPDSRFPRLQRLFELGERIRSQRPDLLRRYPEDRAADFWYWLLWHGASSFPELGEARYPAPDRFLRERVVGGAAEAEAYQRSGLVDAWTLDGCLREAGFDPLCGGRVLDFGAGCGRTLQFFALYSGACELVGADVDPQAVAWCRQHLDFARFEPLGSEPPSPFPDAHFDAVYAFSVFSHLPEDLHLRWLAELRRIAKPGAVLALTVHGRNVCRAALADDRPDTFPPARALRRALPELEKRGFAFFPYGKLAAGGGDRGLERILDPERYGSAFVFEPYVRERWGALFEVVAHREAPDDWQDYVVLRR